MKKIFFAVAIFVVALAATGCTKLLLSEPRGEDASQAQVESNVDALDVSLKGLYSIMYIGSDLSDSEFSNEDRRFIEGQKFIDLVSDMLASDVACPQASFNWLANRTYMDEYLSNERFNNWLWKYEYNNIRNANSIIARCNLILDNQNSIPSLKEHAQLVKAQAVIMRAHFYSNLFNFYVKPGDTSGNFGIIYHDETDMNVEKGLTPYNEVVDKVIASTTEAIGQIGDLKNPSKVGLDANIAKMILAYIHLNRGRFFDETKKTESCTEALRLAKEVIAATKATNPILPYEAVLTNGFNNVGSSNWMWGVDVTPEKSYSLYCFFSFVDIYTLSYASYGEYAAIDKDLYGKIDEMLDAKDRRKEWWTQEVKAGGMNFYYLPNNKFFDKNRIFRGNRNWDTDYVFMRSEEAYLIAAEAAYALGNEAEARTYLKELVAQRSPDNVNAIDALTGDKLKDYIAANWRIEMWLEGKTFMALKRFKWETTRASNHFYWKGRKLDANSQYFYFEIPLREKSYNPYL